VNELAELLDWDSRFFDMRIARIVGSALDDAAARQVVDWCAQERVECLYFLADANCEKTISTAERFGFGLKDVRVTAHRRLDRTLTEVVPVLPTGVCIRGARPDDTTSLEALAEGSYTESRFYYDRRFDPAAVEKMYRTWIRQSITGQADMVLVLEVEGRPRGFITCHLSDRLTARCGLAGIDATLRGQGLGFQLYTAALRWFAQRDVETVVYVTQARNIRVQRLYQRLGFLPYSVQLWYHKWFDLGAVSAGVKEAA
jgi:dTDP-4-amino-4,6-dideoxy-D-galactose acyltransferase